MEALSPATSLNLHLQLQQQQQQVLLASPQAPLPTLGAALAGTGAAPALLTVSVAGCSAVEAVVLMVSWLSQVVNLLTGGGQLSGDMLTILTGQAEAVALHLPVPQLTVHPDVSKVTPVTGSDASNRSLEASTRPLQSVSAKEIVLRVLQGQLPAMLACTPQDLQREAAAAGLEALGALMVTPVHYVAPERDPLGVMVPAAELQQQVTAAGATVGLSRAGST